MDEIYHMTKKIYHRYHFIDYVVW